MKTTVSDIMTRDVFAVASDTSLETVARLLSERHITGAPVIDAYKRPIGVITLTDIVNPPSHLVTNSPGKPIFYYVTHEGVTTLHDQAPVREGLVEDVMSPFVLSVPPDKSVMDAARLMVADGVHRLLVIEDGKLVGIVSSMDALRAFTLQEE